MTSNTLWEKSATDARGNIGRYANITTIDLVKKLGHAVDPVTLDNEQMIGWIQEDITNEMTAEINEFIQSQLPA